MTFQDVFEHFHQFHGQSHLPVLIDALVTALRLNKLQLATPSGLAIEKEREEGAKSVNTISLNPDFSGRETFFLIDGFVDQLLYQPELRNREIASIITYLRCLFWSNG